MRKKRKKKKKGENNIIINYNKKRAEGERYNISIERRPHYCTHASEEINNNKKNEEQIIGNNIDINKEIQTNNDENNNDKEKDKDKKINKINEQISNTPTTCSIKSDSEEVNYEEDMK